jgi:hypothetical protein
MTSDVYAACEELDRKGVKFQNRPDEGRMKGLAFVLGELERQNRTMLYYTKLN